MFRHFRYTPKATFRNLAVPPDHRCRLDQQSLNEEAILLADTILVMTARPGRIAAEIAVELPRPRSLATTHDPTYGQLFDRIYGLLRDEVVKAMTREAEND